MMQFVEIATDAVLFVECNDLSITYLLVRLWTQKLIFAVFMMSWQQKECFSSKKRTFSCQDM